MARTTSIRTFYILILTQTFSYIGSQMTELAVGIKIFNDTGQVTPLALVGFFGMLPRILATSFAGVLADRWDRRYVLIVSDAGQALATLILLLTLATGTFELWILYILTIWQATFAMFQGPAFNASVTQLVPDAMRDRANAIQQITGPAAGLIAPVLAGVLFAVIGVTGVIVVDIVTFLVAVAVVASVHIPRPAQTDEGRAAGGSVWREMASGFTLMWKLRPMFYLLLLATLLNFLGNMTGVMIVPYVLLLTGSEAMLGTLMALLSLGMVVGGVLVSVRTIRSKRMHIVFLAIIVEALFLALLGVVRTPLTLAIVMFLYLLPNPMVNAPLFSLVQAKTPPDMQGRVFAAIMQLAMLAMPLAYLLAGPLADRVLEPAVGGAGWDLVAPLVGSEPGAGIGLLFIISGLTSALAGAAFYAWPRMRHLESELPDYAPVNQSLPGEEARDALTQDAEPLLL